MVMAYICSWLKIKGDDYPPKNTIYGRLSSCVIGIKIIASENKLLTEKINAMEVEKNNLINEDKVHALAIDDIQVSMDEMKSNYEEIFEGADLVSNGNQLLSGDNSKLKASDAVLQAEKDEVECEWIKVQSESELIPDGNFLLIDECSNFVKAKGIQMS